jgi:hypothetical protein
LTSDESHHKPITVPAKSTEGIDGGITGLIHIPPVPKETFYGSQWYDPSGNNFSEYTYLATEAKDICRNDIETLFFEYKTLCYAMDNLCN